MFFGNFMSSLNQYRSTIAYLVTLPIFGVAASYCWNWWRQQQALRDAAENHALLLQEEGEESSLSQSQLQKKGKRKRNRSKRKPSKVVDAEQVLEEEIESSDLEEAPFAQSSEQDLLLLAKLQGKLAQAEALIKPKPLAQSDEQEAVQDEPVAEEDADDKAAAEEWTRVATRQEEMAAHWRSKAEQTQAELTALQAEHEGDKRRAEQTQARLQQQETQLREQIRTLSQHTAGLESEAHGLRIHNRDLSQKLEHALGENSSARERVNLLEAVVADLEAKLGELVKLRGELDAAAKAKETLNLEHEQLEKERSGLVSKLNAALEEIRSQREMINTLESYRSRFTSLEIECTTRGQLLHRAEVELAQLRDREKVQSEKLHLLTQELQKQEQERAHVSKQREQEIARHLEQQQEQFERETQQMKEEREHAIKQMEEEREHAIKQMEEEREQAIKQMEEEREQALRQLEQEHNAQQENLVAECHRLQQSSLHSQAALEQAQAEMATLRQQLAQASPSKQQPSQELLAVKKKFAELLHQHVDLRRERDQQLAQAQELSSQLNTVQSHLQALEKQAQQAITEREHLLKQQQEATLELVAAKASQSAQQQWTAQLLETMAASKLH